MSYFILYFETQRKELSGSSHNITDNYEIDNEIFEGKNSVSFNGRVVEAIVIASRMDSSIFYVFKKPTKMIATAERVRHKFFTFIQSRLNIGAIAYLYIFDLMGNWPKQIDIRESALNISFDELDSFLKQECKKDYLQ